MRRMKLTVILGALLAGTMLLTTGCAQPDDGTKIEKPSNNNNNENEKPGNENQGNENENTGNGNENENTGNGNQGNSNGNQNTGNGNQGNGNQNTGNGNQGNENENQKPGQGNETEKPGNENENPGQGGNENENQGNENENPGQGNETEKPGKTYEAPTNIELSNGYFIRQFMGSGQSIAKATAVDDVNHYLGEAETYIKGLVNELEQSTNGNTYFSNFINGYKENDFYKITGTGSGAHAMDYLLSINANNYTYILEDIIKNVDEENRYIFSRAYQFLANEAQYAGLGNVTSLGTQLAETVYTKEKQNLKEYGDIWGINFDVDINTGVPEITNKMDEVLNQAAGNMYGVTANDLKKVINISLTNNSLGALHDAQVNNLEHNLKAGCTMEYSVEGAYGTQGLSYSVYRDVDMALTNARYAAEEADKTQPQTQDYVMGR